MARSSNFHEDINEPDIHSGYLTQPRMPFKRETSWTSLATREQQYHQTPEITIEGFGEGGDGREQAYDSNAQFSQLQVPRAYSPFTNDSGEDDRWSTNQPYTTSRRASSHTDIPLISRTHQYPPESCPSHGNVVRSGWTFFNLLVIIAALISWSLSGIFLGTAIARPRWGFRVGTPNHLSYDTATLLSALLSKLVELTFASTICITLGQILSRKAVADSDKKSRNQGISLAELNMKYWIVQPGTFVTHFAGVRHVIGSLIGIMALVAAISAAFYTTAAEALVSPKLKFGNNQTMTMVGSYSTNFGNVEYMGQTCATGIHNYTEVGSTCMQIDFAGNGFRNLQSWSALWQNRQNGMSDVALQSSPRPPPTALLYDNTTVHGLWIHPSGENITTDSEKHGRLVQNTTMVMPHANIFHAARNPQNKLLQPDDLQGLGEYYIQAAVPVPGVNVLCVGVAEDEINPVIGRGEQFTTPPGWGSNVSTPIDSIFGWSHNPNNITTSPYPFFGKLPKEFNTVGNTTATWYGVQSVYFLAKPPNTTITQDYLVCSVRSFQYSDCSTSLSSASSGSDLSVNCGSGATNWKSYETAIIESGAQAPVMTSSGADINYVLQDWLRAVSLTSGINDADTSLAHYATEMIPTYRNDTPTLLPNDLPTIGEAICVLAGYAILKATDSSPFVNYWDNPSTILTTPLLGNFSALVSYKDYQSGGDVAWKSVFYVILASVFVLNSLCVVLLVYYFGLQGEVTDFTDLQNVFTIALNSPASWRVAGACGSGPSTAMLGAKWWVDMKVLDGGVGGMSHPLSRSASSLKRSEHAHFLIRFDEQGTATGSVPVSRSLGRWVGDIFATPGRRRNKSGQSGDLSELVNFDQGQGSRYMKLNGH